MLAHRVRVVADQVGRFFDFADCFESTLAVLPGEGGPIDDGSCGDEVSSAIEQVTARSPGRRRPGRLRHRGDLYDIVDIVAVSDRKMSDSDRRIDW